MEPADADDPAWDVTRHIASYVRIVGVASGILCQSLSYADVRRLVSIDDESIEARGDDPLATEFVDGFSSFDGASIEPSKSIAALFDTGFAKTLKPRALLAHDLRAGAALVGVLTVCKFAVDGSLATDKFTRNYCRTHGLPNLERYLLVDVVMSRRKPAGSLLLLAVILQASRSRPPQAGVCCVAVTTAGRDMCAGLGFELHAFRDQGQRWLCHLALEDIQMSNVMDRLHFGGRNKVASMCWRWGLTSASSDRLVGRCG